MRLTSNDSQRLDELEKQVEELKRHVFRTERKTTTPVRQQLLLFHQLGLLDKLNELSLSGVKKAKLLSILLNASEDNIRKDLSQVNKKNSELKNEANFSFLVKMYDAIGLTKHRLDAEKTLRDILNKKEK